MTLNFYRVVHIVGIALILLPLGGLLLHAITNPSALEKRQRRLIAITHGIGMLITLIAGVGLLHKSGYTGMDWPGWVYVKLLVWLVLGLSLSILRRVRSSAAIMWFALPGAVLLAAYLAIYKPF